MGVPVGIVATVSSLVRPRTGTPWGVGAHRTQHGGHRTIAATGEWRFAVRWPGLMSLGPGGCVARVVLVPPPPTNPDRVWLLNVPYRGEREQAEARWGGAEYDRELKLWRWDGGVLPKALRPLWCPPFSWERWIEDNLNGWQTGAKGGKLTPRKHQVEAALAIRASWDAGRPGFLLADDVGLGKTISALEGVRRLGTNLRVLVLCPLSVVPHWRRSIELYGTHGNRFCVINYDRVKRLLSTPKSADKAVRTRTKNKRIAAEGVSLVDWDVVIADESHQLRNPTSQRSAAVRQLIKGISDQPAFVVWASATAGQNPLELSYLAPLLAAVTGQRTQNLADFEKWCERQGIRVKKGAYGKWEWLPNPRDLKRMHTLLFEGSPAAGIRRRPTDIAGWPEQQRVLHPIELSFVERAQYLADWTVFRRDMKLRAKGSDPKNALAAQIRFRQKASLLRAPHVAAFVSTLVDAGVQVAVSCEFLETVDQLAALLSAQHIAGSIITGETPPAEREAQRLAFQRGETKVCLFTVCEGISLHAGEAAVGGNNVPRVTVVADPRWSAISGLQIEGRCHRDGQAAVVYYCHASPGTIETKVVNVLVQRMQSTKVMVGDDTETLREIERIVAHQLDFGTSSTAA